MNVSDLTTSLKGQIMILCALLLAIFLYFVTDFSTIPLIIGIVICGIPLIFQIGLKILQGDYGADILAALAVITALFVGEYLAANIVLLMLASGQVLEFYAIRRASSVLLALSNRMPSSSHRKVGTKIEDILISDIKVGDLIVIYPYETCPVDGHIVEGHGSMDESYLTGEPYQISKAPGVSVISGAINADSLLVISADKLPQDSRYANIMKVMEESEQKRPRLRRLSDQLGAIFAPIALLIAGTAWFFTDDPIRFLAVLVIATPCPLLIAIPITIISAISKAAQKGIIIKDPLVLERLPTCRTAIFDKTGTLTYGRAELVEITTFSGFKEEEVFRKVASLERFSKHPLASAVIHAAKDANLDLRDVDKIIENPGQGIVGMIGEDKIEVTSRKFILGKNPQAATILPESKPGMESIIIINDKIAGIFQFRDTLRSEGYSFINHLKPIHHFKRIMIVSGDRLSEVKYLADQLNIKKIFASQSPEQKVEIVRRETLKSPTLFMGDGINDAPALAVATVGLAFGHENIVATEAAGAVILENSLSKVDELIHISALMRHAALISAVGGMLLSFIGMYFAAIGMIKPVVGALLQEGIDILAILVALQLTYQSKIVADIKEY